jgi:hypothetical protein
MNKTILKYGVISGLIASGLMWVTMAVSDRIGMDRGALVGYATIVLSLLLVYFGIRSYRDTVGGGQITFWKGFLVGMGITVISCLFYVVTWEIVYFNFMHDFMDKYSAHVVEKMTASGASQAAIAAKIEEMRKLKVMYENPLINSAMTFIEPFPVGVVLTLISAGILRRRKKVAEAVVG